jgi:hypothetical protein
VAGVTAVNCTAVEGAAVTTIGTSSVSVPFGTLFPPNTFFFGCQDLVVPTNAGGGYSLTVQEQTLLRSLGGFTIPQTTCDAGACILSTAAAWATPTNNVIALMLLGYVLRRNFRSAWHVLRTGDDNPDWEKLGGDHYIANWERRFWKLPAGKKEAKAQNVSE